MNILQHIRHKLGGLRPMERRYFLAMNIGVAFALGAHTIFTLLFLHLGLTFMVIFNLFSLVTYAGAMALVYTRKAYFLGMILAGIEVPLHQVLAVLFLGTASGFQYYLLVMLVVPFFFPSKYNLLRITLAAVSLLTFVLIQTLLVGHQAWFPAPQGILDLCLWVNMSAPLGVILVLSFFSSRAVEQTQGLLEAEHQRAEDLLHHILPKSIATRLKHTNQTIADGFESVSVLFSDIVGFTGIAAGMPPGRVVELLGRLFSTFDELSAKHDLEKIKTIGDSYMVAAGVPNLQVNHARKIALFALDMLEALETFNIREGVSFQMRIGINSGPVVAGVIGSHKFIYDLWGDTVNMASRMESSGLPGEIQVTEETYRMIREDFEWENRPCVEIKGRGCMDTWLLRGLKDSPQERKAAV